VNGLAAVLTTGLSGSLDAQLAPPAPDTGSAGPAPTGGDRIVVGSGGSAVTESGTSASEDVAGGPATVTQGVAPAIPSITYEDANSLTWVVNGTRVEILSNLPVAELQKIAGGLTLAK
jgi:hypothetical protein